MDGEWQVGDVALCVKRCPQQNKPAMDDTTRPGRFYAVQAVRKGYAIDGVLVTGLRLEGAPHPGGGSDARRFVKVTPFEADAFDHEIIGIMNGKPVPAETA